MLDEIDIYITIFHTVGEHTNRVNKKISWTEWKDHKLQGELAANVINSAIDETTRSM